jgi:asparagine synthase (glutamine-hydrolysing)
MCGIAGLLSFDGGVESWTRDLERSVALTARRGPDAEGFWTDGDTCSLGFRRLSVLDPTPAGDQPMLSADGRFALVCNGEVYNYRELRHELEQVGVRFGSTGDSEVVLQALIRWGTEVLARFNGMFALAFYDRIERRIILARDHAGMKPLYVLRADQGVVFGSQYDQILSHPWSRGCAILRSSLSLYLHFDYIPAPYALHERVSSLRPGSWLKIDATGRSSCGRFFEFDADREPDLSGDEADEALDAALVGAVRRHMISDVPIGTFLSGGIDSPLIAAVMQKQSDRPLPAFTVGTDGGVTDETADARVYASEIGVEHHVRPIRDEAIPGLVEAAAEASAEPLGDYSILPTLHVSAAARRHVTVMLSGDGGDELFWGYAGRVTSVMRRAAEFGRPRLVRMARAAARGRLRDWEVAQPTIGDVYRAHQSFVPARHLRRVLPGLPPLPADFTTFDYAGSETDRTARWLRSVEFGFHLPRILQKVDRASMYHSLEVRMPLLDREVIGIAERIDWRTCIDIDRGTGKRPLRRALAARLRHQTSGKRGFTVPMGDWLRGPLRGVFEDCVALRPAIAGQPLDRAVLRRMAERHMGGTADYGWLFWRLLSLQLWSARHGARQASG